MLDKIHDINNNLREERKVTTILVGLLLALGFISSIPMFSDKVKFNEVLYCAKKDRKCKPSELKRGINFLVEREFRNKVFSDNVEVVEELPSEDPNATVWGLFSSIFFLTAWGLSKGLTSKQLKLIHSQFKVLKIQALEDNLIEGVHLDLKGFTLQNQGEITKQSIARQTQETIQELKTEGELQLDHLNGTLQGELSLKSHQLEISNLEVDIAKNELEVKELRDKLKTTPNKDKENTKDKEGDKKDLKMDLINDLKNHEGGWLWYLVESFTPIIIHGKAGSYKSYTAASIALLKHYLIDAKVQSIADIDYEQNKKEAWKYLDIFEPNIYGEGIDWENYGRAYDDAVERSKLRTLKDSPIISIWDELTNAKGKFSNAPNIVPFVIATPRKRNEHCILISHNLTQDCLGGCSGISEPIKTQTYRLNLKTTPRSTPLFKGTLEGLVDEDGNELEQHPVTLPEWLRPNLIYEYFNKNIPY